MLHGILIGNEDTVLIAIDAVVLVHVSITMSAEEIR